MHTCARLLPVLDLEPFDRAYSHVVPWVRHVKCTALRQFNERNWRRRMQREYADEVFQREGRWWYRLEGQDFEASIDSQDDASEQLAKAKEALLRDRLALSEGFVEGDIT